MAAPTLQQAFTQGRLRASAPVRSSVVTRATPDAEAANRRQVLGVAGCALLSTVAPNADAIQGSTAGRIPGVSPDPNAEGFSIYQRPVGKSGGHGVGWSEIPRYQFEVPPGWAESPVSIADLGGTEIDVRFYNRLEGSLQVVVAPVLRFRDVGYNANVDMEYLGTPDLIINGFAPELYGQPLDDGDVLATQVVMKGDEMYYQWSLKPHRLVTATATGNRLFVLATSANSIQWKKGGEHLRCIQDSFYVPPVRNTMPSPVVMNGK